MLPERLTPYLLLFLSLLLLFTPIEEKPVPQTTGKPTPPRPPVVETFQSSPQLSLFPRLGDFRPEDDEDRLRFWLSYREHLVKISGLVEIDPTTGNKAFIFRGIKRIDSVGHFAPLEVKPNTSYRIGIKLKAELPEGATAGLGIIEYKQFLWVGEQYPESLHKKFFLANRELLRVNRTDGWQSFDFEFTTGPQTGMIHLVLFREGPASNRMPVLVDNLSVLEK